MENMRFMTNMNDQYTNESDNEEDSDDDVEDIDSGNKLVNVFDNDEDDGKWLYCPACSLSCMQI